MKRKLKHIILLCVGIAFFSPSALNAQRKGPINLPTYDNERYHYGFILGYNQMLLSIDYKDNFQDIIHASNELPSNDVLPGTTEIFQNSPYRINNIIPHMTHGFTVGIVGNLRLANHFDLRLIPSLSFGERKITYDIVSLQDAIDPETGEPIINEIQKTITSTVHSTFVEFPLQVKYKSKRHNNAAAYIIAGANYKIDMASRKKNYDPNNKPKNLTVNRHDVAAEIGAGFDFYTGYFKLGIELKMSYGLLDIAQDKDYMYTNSFDNLRNKAFQLSFTFE